MTIWVATWDTESGDSGVVGYWKSKPTQKKLDKYMAKGMPDDYEAKTLYYSLESLKEVTA